MSERRLGDYDVIKEIGQGLLGTVLLAEHRFMKRHCVLKLLPPELAEDRAFLQRFEDEVARLAALEHPHIVKVHNVSYADGLYFLVCDCVVDGNGETCNLGQFMEQEARLLDEGLVQSILGQIASALDYAHGLQGGDAGLVHRGLKLSNILLSRPQGQEVQVKLSDFGLARIVGTSAVLSQIYQNMAEGLGCWQDLEAGCFSSPPIDSQRLQPLHRSFLQNYVFLAPEQKWGENPAVTTAAADVWAFGVLAYHLLTGIYPEGVFEPVALLRSELQLAWDELIQSCLAADPAKRPSSLTLALESLQTRHRTNSATLGAATQPAAAAYFVSSKDEVESPDFSADENTPQPLIGQRSIERPSYDPDPAAAFQVDGMVTTYQPQTQQKTEKIEPLQTDMVIVKGGSYVRGSEEGSRDEMPRHPINLRSFAMDVHPVTNEQFVRFLEAMGGEKDASNQDIIRLKDARIKRSRGAYIIESGYAKHPVVGVTWYGALGYARWVGKRLPTEAEWEIAAMGGSDGVSYPTGDGIEKTQANFFSSDTTAVESYAPNSAGIFDMAGNVYEWCQDWYGYNFYEASALEPDNPTGPLQGVYRVLRGGCWKSLKEDLRCAHRHRNNPGTVNSTYGFRCAAEVQ